MDLAENRQLVRNLDQRVLREDDVEARVGEWQWPRRDEDAADPGRQAGGADPDGHLREQRRVDVDADDAGRGVPVHEQLIDRAETAADVEDGAAAEVRTPGQPPDPPGAPRG